jgi:lipoic acid synthetase
MSSIQAPSRGTPETHQRNAEKLARIPIKVEKAETVLRKPEWIRIKLTTNEDITHIKQTLRKNKLHSVCEEAACPNLNECFSLGTATFMIMGDICTRRCPFCDVAHGKPLQLDADEPLNLAKTIKAQAPLLVFHLCPASTQILSAHRARPYDKPAINLKTADSQLPVSPAYTALEWFLGYD